jgi:hypothetical protein
MLPEDFARYSEVLHRMTTDFVSAVPEDRWDFTPVPRSEAAPGRLGRGFAPFSKQLRHVVCVRGVYNDALRTGRIDWSRSHSHYTGPLERDALVEGLDGQQRSLISILKDVDPDAVIDLDGYPFTLALFFGEFVQHEAIHHGQWSLYAALAGFETPQSWADSWRL